MASARSAWGIDLGSRALKAVKLTREGDRLRVEDFEIIEHEQILSVSGDNKESLLQTALAQFTDRHSVKNTPVAVGVSGQQSFARFIKLPPVEDKKIPEIVRFEAIQQIPFPLDDVEWSYQLFRQPDSPDVEVGIFAMKKDLVNRQIAYFTSLDMNVQVVQMSPLAVYNAMHYDDRVGQTTMFMDSGAEATDLIIAEGESVWLRTLPIGGNNFTEALAKAFKLSFQKAEELKRNAATSKYAKQIFQAMRPVFADLVSEIQRSIGFYASVHRDARIARIVALGSTFQLPGLQKYLQQNLQLQVEKLDAFRALPPADAKLATTFQEGMISLASAYGLAVQALGDGKITSSLLPATIRRQKLWQEKTPWFGLAAACFVVGAVGVGARWYLDDMAYERNQPVRDQYKQTLAQAQATAAEWNSDVQDKGAEDRTKILNIRALQEYRGLWSQLLADIVEAAPKAPLDARLKQTPRGQRPIVLIDSITSSYRPNLTQFLADNADLGRLASSNEPGAASWGAPAAGGGFGGAGPRGFGRGGAEYGGRGYEPPAPTPTPEADPNAPPADAPRGFVITIQGTTPHRGPNNTDGSRFVDTHFVQKLVASTVDQQLAKGRPYHIAKAQIVNAGPRRVGMDNRGPAGDPDDPDALTTEADLTNPNAQGGGGARGRGDWGGRGGSEFTGGRGFPVPSGRGAPATSPNAEGQEKLPDPTKDRVYPEESIEQDTQFTIVAVVVLDPKPPAPKPAPDQAASSQ